MKTNSISAKDQREYTLSFVQKLLGTRIQYIFVAAMYAKMSNGIISTVRRSVVLYLIGVCLALVLHLLQIQRNVTLFPVEVIGSLMKSDWWVPPVCGAAAGKLT